MDFYLLILPRQTVEKKTKSENTVETDECYVKYICIYLSDLLKEKLFQ